MDVKPVYLIMITEQNNNKYYNCFPNGDGTFTVKYGRVGGHESTTSYPMSKWNAQINSKIKKGYVDRSDLMTDVIEDSKVEPKKDSSDEFSVIKNTSVRDIIKRLFDFANKVVQSSYKVSASVVTQSMIDTAQEYIDNLSNECKNLSIEEFNKLLIKIFNTIPRKMDTVKNYLAKDTAEFTKIIEREQDTLDAMRGQVYKRIEKKEETSEEIVETASILEKMGITMEDATDEDVAKIKKAMGDSAHKFYKAWRVSNKETEKNYNKFVKENNIGNVQLLCHGSRNQNWFNILKTGLKIRPAGAIITGAMFGYGIYWSNPSKYHGGVAKSIGYTSLGGYWTKDYQNCGFLAFFDVALGDSYDVYSFDSKYYNFDLNRLKKEKSNAWNLFAHGGTGMLRNDEIIVYTDKQMTIRYLVEIR